MVSTVDVGDSSEVSAGMNASGTEFMFSLPFVVDWRSVGGGGGGGAPKGMGGNASAFLSSFPSSSSVFAAASASAGPISNSKLSSFF